MTSHLTISGRRLLPATRAAAIVAAVLVCCLLPAGSALAQSSAMFVDDFNRLVREKKTAMGVTYRVEGRLSSVSGRLLRLQKCPTVFWAAEGYELGAARRAAVVELSGQFEQRDGRTVFVVRRLKPLADYAGRYRTKKSLMPERTAKDPESWYGLARWIGRRADFYGDPQLAALRSEANRKGVDLEKRRLPKDDPEGLLALAKKVDRLGLPRTVSMQYIHEAYRVRWEQARKRQALQWQKLIEQMEKALPGCTERLPTPQPELERRYRENPLATYRAADPLQRRKLHRLLYIEVVLASILEKAQPDGSNGYEIAEAIDARLPEKHQLAEQFREREMTYRSANVENLTRREVLDLADRFRRRNQPAKAQSVVAAWLAAIERQLRQEGPAGLMQAADHYLDLIEDREKAARLLLEADRLIPNSAEVAEKLRRLGYVRRNGAWIKSEALRTLPDDPIRRAAREGRVVAGMTGDQVRSILGLPGSVTRVATSGEISELWAYGRRGTGRLTVHLRRRSHEKAAVVLRVFQMPPTDD